MTLDTFEELCKKISLSKLHDSIYFIWHGGEPLLLGRYFYDECFRIEEKYFKRENIVNTFQSNCTLIDGEWISWLKEKNIKVSTSLDGDKERHDINRIKEGKGSFDDTFTKIKALKEHNLLNGVVTVVSRTNLNHLDYILKFFSENGIITRLNPIMPSPNALDELSITPEEYANALIKCFDNWFDSKYGEKYIIAPLNEIIHSFFSSDKPQLCNFSGDCSNNFIAMNPVGDLFNCGRFSDIEKYKIANIKDNISWDSVFEKKGDMICWDESVLNDCNDCRWYQICNKGCPNTSFLFHGKIRDKDPYCIAYKMIFEHLYNKVNQAVHLDGNRS